MFLRLSGFSMRRAVVFPREPAKAPAGDSYKGKKLMQIITVQLKPPCFDSPILRVKTRRDERAVFGMLLTLLLE